MLFPGRSVFPGRVPPSATAKTFWPATLFLICFSASVYTQAKEASRFIFDRITLDGAKQLGVSEQTELTQDYLYRSLTLSDINQLIQALTNQYIDRGYITTRIYLRPQNLSNRELTLTVLEGIIEKIEVLDEGHPRIAKPNMAFPGLTGEALNLRELEQGIEQISRLPSFETDIKIQPGTAAGSSAIAIASKRQRPWRFSTSIDNARSQLTGNTHLEASLGLDDLLGFYDQWSFITRRNTHFYEKNNVSRLYDANVSIPFGYWTFRWVSTTFDYLRTIQGQSQEFFSKGDDWRHQAEVERVIHRNSSGKTALSGFLATKKVRNYVNNTLIGVSSRTLSRGGGRLSHDRRLWGGALSALLVGEQAAATFGTRTVFTKWNAQLHYRKPFVMRQELVIFDSSLLWQWAPNTSYSSERLSIGDHSTVRGFLENGVSGDQGGYIRNELIWILVKDTKHPKLLGPVALFTGFDMGWIPRDKKNQFGGGVTGISTGLRTHGGALFGEFSFEKSLTAPSFVPKEKPVFFFKVGISLEKILAKNSHPDIWRRHKV